MVDPVRLEVWRGKQLRMAGSPPELLAAAQAGAIRHDDAIRVAESGATFRPAEIPFLAPYVPSRLEARTRRNVRALYVLSGLLLPLAALWVAGAWLYEGLEGLRNALFPVFIVVVLVAAPIPALRNRLRQLEALRARGLHPDERAQERTTGDARLDALLRQKPIATWAAIGVIVAVSAIAPPGTALWQLLAKTNERLAAGDWWRLVTPMLVHGGVLHLGINMLALSNIGPAVESFYGRAQLLAILVVGTLGATLASYWFTNQPAVPSVGASGGIFALVGALLVFGLLHRNVLARPARDRLVRGMLWVVAVNLAIGFSATFIDNAAHIGGLITGAVLGAVLPTAGLTRRVLGRPEAG